MPCGAGRASFFVVILFDSRNLIECSIHVLEPPLSTSFAHNKFFVPGR